MVTFILLSNSNLDCFKVSVLLYLYQNHVDEYYSYLKSYNLNQGYSTLRFQESCWLASYTPYWLKPACQILKRSFKVCNHFERRVWFLHSTIFSTRKASKNDHPGFSYKGDANNPHSRVKRADPRSNLKKSIYELFSLTINSSKKRENAKGPRINIHLIANTICLYEQMFIVGRSAIEHTEQTRKIFSLTLIYNDLRILQSQNLKNYPQK